MDTLTEPIPTAEKRDPSGQVVSYWDLTKATLTALSVVAAAGCSTDRIDESYNNTTLAVPAATAAEIPTAKDVLSNPEAWRGKEIVVSGELTLRSDLSTVEGYVSSSGAGSPLWLGPFLESAGLRYATRYDLKYGVEPENVIPVLVEGRMSSGKVKLNDLLLKEGSTTVTGKVEIFGNSKLPFILLSR